jgi:hypothetical protein
MLISLLGAIVSKEGTSAQCFVAFVLFLIATVVGVIGTIAYLEDQKQ